MSEEYNTSVDDVTVEETSPHMGNKKFIKELYEMSLAKREMQHAEDIHMMDVFDDTRHQEKMDKKHLNSLEKKLEEEGPDNQTSDSWFINMAMSKDPLSMITKPMETAIENKMENINSTAGHLGVQSKMVLLDYYKTPKEERSMKKSIINARTLGNRLAYTTESSGRANQQGIYDIVKEKNDKSMDGPM